MNRAPYRRVTAPRGHSGEYTREHDAGEDGSVSYGETLIMQCIICGIIMVFVLIASMADVAPAAAVRGGISQVLTGATTLDELITDVRQFGADWLDWELGPPQTAEPEEFYIPTTTFPEEPPTFNFEQTALPYPEYTNSDHLPPAADDQESNLTVPEPPVTPGLWD